VTALAEPGNKINTHHCSCTLLNTPSCPLLHQFASPESMAREVGLGPTCTVRIANHATSWASWLLQVGQGKVMHPAG
jgi:hypothetical protein